MTVLITGGIGTFSPRPLPDADDYEERGLVYFVPRLDDLTGHGRPDRRRRRLGLRLGRQPGAGRPVRDTDPPARRRSARTRARSTRCCALVGARADAVRGRRGSTAPTEVEAWRSSTTLTGDARRLPVQAVVAALGFTADLGPFTRWGLEQRKRHIARRLRHARPTCRGSSPPATSSTTTARSS